MSSASFFRACPRLSPCRRLPTLAASTLSCSTSCSSLRAATARPSASSMPVVLAKPPSSPRSQANASSSPRSQAKSPRRAYPPVKPTLSPSKLLGQPSENLGDNTNRGDSSSLIIRREAVVKQLLDFATKWSQAAAPAKRGTRGAVDVLATRLTSLHLKPAPAAEPALRALEAARAVAAHMIAELADVTLRLVEALVVEPVHGPNTLDPPACPPCQPARLNAFRCLPTPHFRAGCGCGESGATAQAGDGAALADAAEEPRSCPDGLRAGGLGGGRRRRR